MHLAIRLPFYQISSILQSTLAPGTTISDLAGYYFATTYFTLCTFTRSHSASQPNITNPAPIATSKPNTWGPSSLSPWLGGQGTPQQALNLPHPLSASESVTFSCSGRYVVEFSKISEARMIVPRRVMVMMRLWNFIFLCCGVLISTFDLLTGEFSERALWRWNVVVLKFWTVNIFTGGDWTVEALENGLSVNKGIENTYTE